MTNKEKIQAAHLEAIIDNCYGECNSGEGVLIGEDYAATSCTTITAEAIGEVMEWVGLSEYFFENNFWHGYGVTYTTAELVQLFLNQKAEI